MHGSVASAVPRFALTTRECAEAIGIGERTLTSWVAAGVSPPSYKHGQVRLFPVDDLRAWLSERAREQEKQTARVD